MGIDLRRQAARLAASVRLTEDEAAALLHIQPATLAAFIGAHRSAAPTRGEA